MSTRSNVIVISPDKHYTQFYRHWDGYFEVTGTDLILKLSNAYYHTVYGSISQRHVDVTIGNYTPRPESFYDWFMFEMSKDIRDPNDYVSLADNSYEFDEDFILHGDIEYLYFIEFTNDSVVLFYRELGVCNEFIKEHCNSTSQSVYQYVSMEGKVPLRLRITK